MKAKVPILALLALLAGCTGVYDTATFRAAVARFRTPPAQVPSLVPPPTEDLGPSVATNPDYHPPVFHEVYENGRHVGSIEGRGDGDIHFESDIPEGVTWIHYGVESNQPLRVGGVAAPIRG
jgi:hypothetical protein